MAREDVLARFPKLGPALHELSRRFTSEQIRRLNFEVDGNHRRPADAAAEALREVGLGKAPAK